MTLTLKPILKTPPSKPRTRSAKFEYAPMNASCVDVDRQLRIPLQDPKHAKSRSEDGRGFEQLTGDASDVEVVKMAWILSFCLSGSGWLRT